MPDPSVDALRDLFFASAKAEHAAREGRYRGSPEQMRLLCAVHAVHPCDELVADIARLRDALDPANVGLPITTPRRKS